LFQSIAKRKKEQEKEDVDEADFDSFYQQIQKKE